MKLFGEYLIECNLISSDALVDSLIEQVRSLPPISEVVRREKLLSPDEILRVFKQESESGASFVSAAKTLNFWNDKIEQTVNRQLKTLRTPIGQILVRRGAIDAQKMTAALDDFLGEREQTSTAEATAKPAPELKVAPSPKTKPESPPLSQDLPTEFSAERLKLLARFFDGMVMQSPKDEELANAVNELHIMKGIARLIGAAKLEKLVSLLEETTRNVQAKSGTDAGAIANLAVSGNEAILVIRSIATMTTQGLTESAYFENPKNSKDYEDAVTVLEKVKSEIAA